MRRGWWAAGLAIVLGGCTSSVPDRVHDYNDDGVYLFRRGQYADARDSFQAALALKADDVGLLYNLGRCYDHLGNATKAEHYYNECLQRAPNDALCRHAQAALLVRENRMADAARMVEDWLAREPKRAAAYAEYGWLHHQTGDLYRARAYLDRALDLDPHDYRALTELALVYEEMDRPERSVVLYERCLRHNPNQPDVARRLAQLASRGVGRPRQDQ